MRFDFINKRKGFYSVAIASSIIAILAIMFLPLNLGIDMTGWIQVEYDYGSNIDMSAIKNISEETRKDVVIEWKDFINNLNIYKITWENRFIIEAWINKINWFDNQKIENLKTQFKDKLSAKLSKINPEIKLYKYINIGESFGDYIKKTAYITIVLTIIAISLYIAWTFRGSIEWFSSFPFAWVTIITLAHDVLAALGFYLITSFFLSEFKVDTYFITAMLTVLGYSVSDTIVIMDRIRTNLRQKLAKKLSLWEIVNNSINETLTRSIFTSFTVFITLVAMFLFGPTAIKWFILAMIYGTIFGTYSSIAIAAPMFYDFVKGNRDSNK